MTQFKGFATKFRDDHGGYLVFEERTPKRKLLTNRGKEYEMCVYYGGLNRDLYPFAVLWNI